MRTSIAYFAGVGTVVVAIAAGLGGGLTIANIMNPNPPRQDVTHLEQRMSPQPIPASNQPDQAQEQPKAPVPYLAATEAASSAPAAAPPSQSQPQAQTPAQNQAAAPPSQTANPAPQRAPRQQAAAPSSQTRTPAPQPAPREQAAATDDATSKARDVDSKRQADKRKADRQQQWTERRKYELQRDQDAQARMQDDDAPRDVVIRRDDRRDWREDRDDSDQPPSIQFPRINLFGPE